MLGFVKLLKFLTILDPVVIPQFLGILGLVVDAKGFFRFFLAVFEP